MGKLHLKRTPEEQRAHDLRKARKAARKAAKRSAGDDDDDSAGPSKRRKTSYVRSSHNDFVFDHEDVDSGYGSHRGHKPDFDYIHAQVEEERFREKMWGAFEDDERLDAAEARFNDYAHIPRRWRGGGMDRLDDELGIDPQMMEEEDYAEWVRTNMWRCDYSGFAQYARSLRARHRKKHAAEFEEQERKKAEKAARAEREKAIRDETRRMEREEERRRRQRRHERETKKWEEARARYETVWQDLLVGKLDRELSFEDIPWPVLVKDIGPSLDKKGKSRATNVVQVDIEDLTLEDISAFLLPDGRPAESTTSDKDVAKKERRDKLRETMLRFHPDKFEGRIMRSVREADKERVREGVGKVARAINDLLAEKGH